MTVQVFGRGMDDQIGPEGDGAGQNGRGNRAVDGEPGAGVMGDARRRRDVGNVPSRVRRRLDPDQPRLARTHGGGQGGEIAGVDEFHLQAPGDGEIDDPFAQGPIHDPGGNHMVAGKQRLKHRRRRRHARGEQQTVAAAFQLGKQVFGRVICRVVRPGVAPARTVTAIGIPLEGGRRMQGRDEGPGFRIDPPQRLGGQGFRRKGGVDGRAIFVGHVLKPSVIRGHHHFTRN